VFTEVEMLGIPALAYYYKTITFRNLVALVTSGVFMGKNKVWGYVDQGAHHIRLCPFTWWRNQNKFSKSFGFVDIHTMGKVKKEVSRCVCNWRQKLLLTSHSYIQMLLTLTERKQCVDTEDCSLSMVQYERAVPYNATNSVLHVNAPQRLSKVA
jgi:hypothetical protein